MRLVPRLANGCKKKGLSMASGVEVTAEMVSAGPNEPEVVDIVNEKERT